MASGLFAICTERRTVAKTAFRFHCAARLARRCSIPFSEANNGAFKNFAHMTFALL
jgi:hypothetical protein